MWKTLMLFFVKFVIMPRNVLTYSARHAILSALKRESYAEKNTSAKKATASSQAWIPFTDENKFWTCRTKTKTRKRKKAHRCRGKTEIKGTKVPFSLIMEVC
jgi:hypothetical protein